MMPIFFRPVMLSSKMILLLVVVLASPAACMEGKTDTQYIGGFTVYFLCMTGHLYTTKLLLFKNVIYSSDHKVNISLQCHTIL